VADFPSVAIYLLEEDELNLMHSVSHRVLPERLALNETVVGQAASLAQTVLASEAQTETQKSHGVLAVPLWHKAKVTGVLSIETSDSQVFMQEDLARMSQLARQISMALERAKLHESLRISEEQSRLLTDNMNDIVSLHSVDGYYQYVSPSCEHILGYSAESLSKMFFTSLIHAEDLMLLESAVFSKLERGEDSV